MRAIIIDDERLALEELEYQLLSFSEIKVQATFTDPVPALDYIRANRPDIVFIDIQMPQLSGLSFAKICDEENLAAKIIFVTAHSEFGAKSYEVNAYDYLTKPVSTLRLEKLIKKLTSEKNASMSKTTERIIVKDKGRYKAIKLSDIAYFRADDKRVEVITEKGKYFTETTMAILETKLCAQDFFKAHRSYIINLNYVDIIEPTEKSFLIKLRGCDELIPLSRSKVVDFKVAMSIL